jgi:hypothetical protein
MNTFTGGSSGGTQNAINIMKSFFVGRCDEFFSTSGRDTIGPPLMRDGCGPMESEPAEKSLRNRHLLLKLDDVDQVVAA